MIGKLFSKSLIFCDDTVHESSPRLTWRLKLSLKKPQLLKSSLINCSLQTTVAQYSQFLNNVKRVKDRPLLRNRRARLQQQISKLRRRLTFLTVQTKGNHPAATARRRFQRSAQSRIRFYYCFVFAALASAQDVIVLPKLGAVAEQIGEVAVDLGSAQFPIILRLVIHDTVQNNGHSCLTNAIVRHSFEKTKII